MTTYAPVQVQGEPGKVQALLHDDGGLYRLCRHALSGETGRVSLLRLMVKRWPMWRDIAVREAERKACERAGS